MAIEDQSGRITLYTVPRRFVVSLLTSLLLVVVHLLHGLGWIEAVIPEDEGVLLVERVLTAIVLLSSYMGWAGLRNWLSDPTRSTVD
jgi:hypothetical protein